MPERERPRHSHHGQSVFAKERARLGALVAAGAEVHSLSAYSPDLIAIEKRCGKLKALLRSAKRQARKKHLGAIAAAAQVATSKEAIGQ